MFTHKAIITPWVDSPVLSEDGVDVQKIRVQGVNEDFQFNAFGFPLNDIAALNGAKSLQEYQAIVSRLQQYQADNPDTSKLSVKDMISNIMPRSFQTPAEIERAASYIGEFYQDKWDEKVAAIRAKQTEKVVEKSAPSSSAPVEYEAPATT